MDISNNTSTISKFILKELEMVYERYNEIPQEEMSILTSFIEKVEKNEIAFDPYLNYNTTKAMAEILRHEGSIDIVRMFLFLKGDVGLDVELEEVRNLYDRLEDYGYVESHCYYIYYKHRENVMEELAKEELLNKLEDSYEVSAMFSDEELADMWIQGMSKEKVAKEYMPEHNWQEILEANESIEGYTDSNGNEVYYCYAGRE